MIIRISAPAGSGKTFFAERLAQRNGAVHLSSDRLRKELFPVQRVYSEGEKGVVYSTMLQRMTEAVQNGAHVILDATFYKEDLRNPFINEAHRLKVKIHFMYISASESLIMKRTTVVREDSEADYEVYLKIKELYEPMQLTHLSLSSEEDNIDDLIQKALEYIQ